MPFFNAGRFISQAVESLQDQTFSSWELIAVDDFSEDNSFEILQELANKDSRIRIIKSSKKGLIPALKLAFQNCKGSYIGRCNADDIYPNERLQMMLDHIKLRGSKTIITGMVSHFSEKSVPRILRKHEAWLNEINICSATWANAYRDCVIASSNWLCTKTDLQSIGAFDQLEYPDNYDLVLRWYKHGFEVECIGEITLYWREHPLRNSHISDKHSEKALFRLKIKRFLEIESFSKLYLWGKGKKAKTCASLLIEAGQNFSWMDLKDQNPAEKGGIPIEDYRYTDLSNGAKLLIGLYPNPAQKRSIEDFLLAQNKIEGKDYWYL